MWKCYLVEEIEGPYTCPRGNNYVAYYLLPDGSKKALWELKVGALWRSRRDGTWVIKLPGYSGQNSWFMEHEGSPGNHWSVTGDGPDYINAVPSINCGKTYHGWVRNGSVTEDCEGRKFDDFGNLLK